MKITSAQIQQPSKHFAFRGKWGAQYWRHLVKDYDGRKVAFDFVKKNATARGFRVVIRLLSAHADVWQRNGRPVVWKWKTAECWVRPDGVVEDVSEKHANKQQQTDASDADWRPFMLALYDQLNREVA